MSTKKCKWCSSSFVDNTWLSNQKYCSNKCKSAASGGGASSGNMIIDGKTNRNDRVIERRRQKGDMKLEKQRAKEEKELENSRFKNDIKKEAFSSAIGIAKTSFAEFKKMGQEEEMAILEIDLGDDIDTILKSLDKLLSTYQTKLANKVLLSGKKIANAYEAKIREGIRKLERIDGTNPAIQKEISFFENEIRKK
jgi:hypothetical protein